MTPFNLRELILEANEIHIGEYTYEGGVILPAISVGNPPNNIQVDGIEVVISKVPSMPMAYRGSQTITQKLIYNVSVFLHNDDYGALFEFNANMLNYFMSNTMQITSNDIPQSRQFESLPGINYKICCYSAIRSKGKDIQSIGYGSNSHRQSSNI